MSDLKSDGSESRAGSSPAGRTNQQEKCFLCDKYHYHRIEGWTDDKYWMIYIPHCLRFKIERAD